MAYTDIDDPSAHFQTALWAGNSSTQTITNDGNSDLQPDWVWLKSRTTTNVHLSQDSTIGATGGVYRYLQPDNTAAEAVQTDGDGITSLNSDGFSLGYGNSNSWNSTGKNYVAWQWKANGGTTSTNTDGSVNTTVQTNTDAGFSIVGYTCPDPITNFTIGHGLGVTPDMFIIKTRDGSRNWGVYHKSLTAPAGKRNLRLNQTNAEATESTFFANIDPTSSVIQLGQNAAVNYQGHNYIAYCFAEKQGYSKFGKYVGNGSTNGPFVYTGFKPAFVMLKRSNTTSNWIIMDNKRNTFNEMESRLFPNLDNAEQTQSTYGLDFLSNGFKLRDTVSQSNGSGSTYIYMAFAENPFTTSTGIPTTAR